MPTVRLPSPLRALVGGAATVEVAGATVGTMLRALEGDHPALGDRLFDDTGQLQGFVNVFVGVDDVRDLDGLDTVVPPHATVSIVPAVAGG